LPLRAADGKPADQQLELRQTDRYVQVVLPLRNKFEAVGSLAVTMPRAMVTDRLEQSFRTLLIVAACLSVAFAWFASVFGPRLAAHRTPWLQIVYALTFLTMSGAVVGTLLIIYSEGAQTKTMALADTLGQRIRDIADFNLNLGEFEGLDRVFGEYRRLNPEITAAGLIVNGRVRNHTDPGAVGTPWVSDRQTYEYVIDLTRPERNANDIRVAVSLPVAVVYRQVVRSVKNFAALFVASAFLAGLFMQLARSVQRRQSLGATSSELSNPDSSLLGLVKPVFFLAIFLEHLTYSFLSQYMQQIVTTSGLSPSFASMPFMAYYLSFALTLIPAGHYAQRVGPRLLMCGGLTLAAAGLLSLTLSTDITLVVAARAVAGIGQAMLFIGVQAYILTTASPGMKTQGAAIIVFGFQGGMISGTAIGSMLVEDLGVQGVFSLSSIIAVVTALYTMLVVPAISRQTDASYGIGPNLRQLGRDLGQALRSGAFLRTILMVGIPAKAVMTGVVIFALPLLLAQKGYAPEDIGQTIMLYAAGVLVASTYVSRFVDRTGGTDGVLFWGTAVSGFGLLLIGLSDSTWLDGWPNSKLMGNLTMITGVVVVGLAHGCINAPIVTHVAGLDIASKIGANSVTATYRFLERIGHAAGPILVAQLFLFTGQNSMVMSWVGGGVMLFGLLFVLRPPTVQHDTNQRKTDYERKPRLTSL
jgi:MFS family permease